VRPERQDHAARAHPRRQGGEGRQPVHVVRVARFERLARDIASGKVQGATVLTPEEIQRGFREQIQKYAPDLDIDAAIKAPEQIDDIVNALGLSRKATSRTIRNLRALYFNTRDGEWLFGGVIPKDYILHQGHTLPGAVGAGATSGADRNDE
jgi:hypothetical protein